MDGTNELVCISCRRDDRIKKASHAEGRSDGKATYICANCGLIGYRLYRAKMAVVSAAAHSKGAR